MPSRSGRSPVPACSSGRKPPGAPRWPGPARRTMGDSPAARRRRRPWFRTPARRAGRAEADAGERVDDEAPALGTLQVVMPSGLGSLPYITCRKAGRSVGRPASPAPRLASSSVQRHRPGRHQAGVHAQPAAFEAWPGGAGAASRARPRARATPGSRPACRCGAGRRTPWATASRCRSWLPSRQVAASPIAAQRCSTASDCGPRLTRSPSSTMRSREGEKPISASSLSKAPSAALQVAHQMDHRAILLRSRPLHRHRQPRPPGGAHGPHAPRPSDPAQRPLRHVGDGAHGQPQGPAAR